MDDRIYEHDYGLDDLDDEDDGCGCNCGMLLIGVALGLLATWIF